MWVRYCQVRYGHVRYGQGSGVMFGEGIWPGEVWPDVRYGRGEYYVRSMRDESSSLEVRMLECFMRDESSLRSRTSAIKDEALLE